VVGITKPAAWEGEPIPPAPGHSLLPAFANDVTIPRDSLWWLHEGNRAFRVGNWKLVAAKGDPWALYDLATDRAEQHDVAKIHPELVEKFSAQWEKQTAEYTELVNKTAIPDKKKKGAGDKENK
jgi:arylsulfatase